MQLLNCADDFRQLGDEISNGAVVVYPTDTVYGLGSSPHSRKGVLRCFELKNRDEGKPMPILFSRMSEVELVVELSEAARSLAKRYWPGKLTMILPLRRDSNIEELLVGKEAKKNLAVRIPLHECALRLIETCGSSLIGTSANVSGGAPSTNSEDLELIRFAEKCDYFVKGECGTDGFPSTVVDLSDIGNTKLIVREGAIAAQEIRKLLGL